MISIAVISLLLIFLKMKSIMNLSIIYLLFAISTVPISAIELPVFQNTAGQMAKRGKVMLKTSPSSIGKDGNGQKIALQKYLKALPYYIKKLLKQNNNLAIFKLLRKFIQVEKAGRYRICFRAFGSSDCSKRSLFSPRPFFIWKKRLVHQLTRDPTSDIIHILRLLMLR